MLNRVKATIKSYNMISDDRPIIIGVSGGPDSMALLHILTNLVSNPLVVAHLNHQFRGIEANLDAEFVRDQCNKMGIPAVIKEYNVPLYMKEKKLGAQEAARKIRYQFYLETAKEWNAGYLALGHHANDQAETLMMRLIRGTGPHGLSGIPYVREFEGLSIIRPLLDITREEIDQYIKEWSIPYRVDQSNFSTKYFRNEIRLNIIPYLQKYNRKLINHLSQIAKLNQAEDDYMQKVATNELNKSLIEKEKDTYILNVFYLQNLDIALQRRVIHLILSYLNLKEEFTFSHIEKILFLISQSHPSKSLDLPNLRVYREYDKIILKTIKELKHTPYVFEMSIPGVLELPHIKKRIRAYVSEKRNDPSGVWDVFDFHLMKEKKITVRSRRHGDRMQIKGMNGSKKVKDIFIDQKIPKEWRDKQPIIEADGQILWIPGIKRSNLKRISENTESFLYIQLEDL
ncbi:tRNA lysidine(34) synthetase TilS [Tepidibacillus fermentans]|uniref:tRNA(Ile)-lysidine synthase n=1 Tax=Tepidibacillus fermentans TaxID=1281767 RepID=A0A4R3KAL4_9BACI|nr:tRNA lysidine(34) synthetase TilS [Tepidibacillus fermentans]TCS80146.1 tRNA(Ile)-lysidine synthase [Tepidibacillus fermentans]